MTTRWKESGRLPRAAQRWIWRIVLATAVLSSFPAQAGLTVINATEAARVTVIRKNADGSITPLYDSGNKTPQESGFTNRVTFTVPAAAQNQPGTTVVKVAKDVGAPPTISGITVGSLFSLSSLEPFDIPDLFADTPIAADFFVPDFFAAASQLDPLEAVLDGVIAGVDGLRIFDASGLDASSLDSLTADWISRIGSLPTFTGQVRRGTSVTTFTRVPESSPAPLMALFGAAAMFLRRVKRTRAACAFQ